MVLTVEICSVINYFIDLSGIFDLIALVKLLTLLARLHQACIRIQIPDSLQR